MRFTTVLAAAFVITLAAGAASAQTYAPVVTLAVTSADGQTQDVVAKDSGAGTLKLKDGTEYMFAVTVVDEPFTRVNVQIVKDWERLGEVQVVKGKPAVDSKTKPAFKIAVKAIELKK